MKLQPFEERPFEVTTSDRVTLAGHIGGRGAPALLLHGGPGVADYTRDLAVELGELFTLIRYTQRGIAPSSVQGPYTIESHMSDALAVLDAVQLPRAWAIGHSWGAHLALHLAVAHPERLLGVICIAPLGAKNDTAEEFQAALLRGLTPEQIAHVEKIDERLEAGEATSEELGEERALLWPGFFFDPAKAPPPTRERGVECTRDTGRSIAEHYEARTLERGLRKVRDLPALFVHGVQDPLPVRASVETAKLMRGAKVARVPQSGHFPWIEQPGFTYRVLRGLFAQL